MSRHKVCLHHKVAELSVIDQLPKQALCRFLTDIHKPCRNPGIIKEIDPAYITVQDRCKQRFRIIPLDQMLQERLKISGIPALKDHRTIAQAVQIDIKNLLLPGRQMDCIGACCGRTSCVSTCSAEHNHLHSCILLGE